MPWEMHREGLALHVDITAPMEGEWETLMDEIQASLMPPPKAIYLPSHLNDGTSIDADMLRIIWQGLTELGIPIMSPRHG